MRLDAFKGLLLLPVEVNGLKLTQYWKIVEGWQFEIRAQQLNYSPQEERY
jgi:hypothetical protein